MGATGRRTNGDQAAAINPTEANANTIPTCCCRPTRSPSSTIASRTVAAGYSEPITLTSDSSEPWKAYSSAAFAMVSSTAI